ncbi:MAG: thioredoxin family protein [Saprospiraceae bacterium]|nr:thioredoxin family protein [Saprospiraceae bacterium]
MTTSRLIYSSEYGMSILHVMKKWNRSRRKTQLEWYLQRVFVTMRWFIFAAWNWTILFPKSIFIIVLCCNILLSCDLNAGNSPFNSNDFDEAVKKASATGKPILINFYAEWCSPCKWMEETTFQDEKVIAIIESNFIALKINIDDIQGLRLKEKFEIKFLPTLLIIDNRHRVIDRIEESIGAERLYDVLQSPGTSLARKKINSNTNPKALMAHLRKDKVYSSPAGPETLKKEDLVMPVRSLYRIQVGVFSSYDGAIRLVHDLNTQFTEPIIILQEEKNEKPHFKVLLGEYNSHQEAFDFKTIMREKYRINGFVI